MSKVRPMAEGGPFKESTFKTIEFGFSPFVPFSETFKMILAGGQGGASDFQVYPQSTPEGPPMTDDWQAIYEAYNKGGRDTLKDLDNIPTSQIQAKAEAMTRELADLLQGKSPIYSEYDTTEKAELEDMIAIEWLLNPDNQMSWKGETWQVSGVTAPNRVLGSQVDSASKEMIDMMATTEAKQKQLEFVLHRIAANVDGGVGFVDDAEGIEVTQMVHKKYTQRLFNEVTGVTDVIERWHQAGRQLRENIQQQFDIAFNVSNNIIDLANKGRLKVYAGSSKKEGGYDTPEYMAMQMIDRFAEISQRHGKDLGVYLWQEPLVVKTGSPGSQMLYGGKTGDVVNPIRYIVGFARFQVDLKRISPTEVRMSNLAVVTRAVDLSEQVTQSGFTDVSEFLKYLDAASSVGYGTLSQFLIMDNVASSNMGRAALIEGMQALGIGLGKWMGVTGQRGELLGSSFRYQVDNISRGAVGGAGSVEAVQVLSSTEVTKKLKAKFKSYFKSKKMKGEFEKFYKKSRLQANEVTDDWKRKVGLGNMNLVDAENVWAKKLYPESAGITGEKMGLPWFFYSGQDPQGYLRFKVRDVNRMLLANIRRDAKYTGIGTQPASADLQQKGGMSQVGMYQGRPITGKRMAGGGLEISSESAMEGTGAWGIMPMAGNWYEAGTARSAVMGVVGKKQDKGELKGEWVQKPIGAGIEALDWRKTVIPK